MAEIVERDRIYVDGAWVPSTGTGMIDVYGAATGEVIGRAPEGTPDDVDRAVAAARAAFPAWADTPVDVRAKYVAAIQQGLGDRMEEIATTIATEVGMPRRLAQLVQLGLPIGVAGSYAQIASEYPFEEQVGNSVVVREPVGVVGAITPWNYPLHQLVAKVAPALVAGCTVVAKPSEVAPLSAFALAEIVDAAGVPAGVFNLVSGTGPVVGEAIAAHPDVDLVSFTGSTRAGKRVAELAAATVKRVALELGGKSANVILPDADLAKAVKRGVQDCYLNTGQTCTALTRMLVPADLLAEAEQYAVAAAEGFRVGDPLDGESTLGPVASAAQQERVRGFIQAGIDEGARLLTGGVEQPAGLTRGYFVKPTVFSGVRPDMTIAREEIFGPVLSIIPYADEEEAIRIANDTPYGLSGAVWSADPEHAKAVARRLRTGQVTINGGAFNPIAPFGGYKQSGLGRELGRHGLEEFLETKAMQL